VIMMIMIMMMTPIILSTMSEINFKNLLGTAQVLGSRGKQVGDGCPILSLRRTCFSSHRDRTTNSLLSDRQSNTP